MMAAAMVEWWCIFGDLQPTAGTGRRALGTTGEGIDGEV
jgi:hypothetical protein